MRLQMSKACAVDTTPSDGSGCDGGPAQVTVCGPCGLLYQVRAKAPKVLFRCLCAKTCYSWEMRHTHGRNPEQGI